MSLEVEVGTDGLGDLSRALTKKRLDFVKLSNVLNEPPRGLSDLMAQSRAFTEKLTHFLEDGSELSDAVKSELVDDNGFPGHVRRLPLEQVYSDLERLKEELRVADGYQPYIVAPEAGLRDLFQRSIGSLVNPVRDLVDSVHGIVTMAADKALNESCQVPSIDRGPPVVRFPNFIESILPVTMEGLEELKDEAMNTAVRIVEMEQSFVSCSFFRYLTFKRIHEQEEAQRERDLGRRPRRNDDDDVDDDDASSIAETEVSMPPVIPGDAIPNVYNSPDAVFGMSGYLEKSSSHSRNKFTQFESSLWQKRFFGVRDTSRTLEYYYSEDAFLKGAQPSVVIQLADCVVADTDGQGILPQSSLSKSLDQLDEETQVSLLISVQNKDPDKPIYKQSKDLILRAEDAADKYRWLNYLRNTISDSRAGAKVATWSTRAIRKPSPPTESTLGSVQERSFSMKAREDYVDILDVGHGLGSAVFWDPICRDQNNGLMPSPGIFIDGDPDLSMEKALVQHATDMKAYTRLACDTLIMTVPKVIVHCLVDKATEKLGPKIEEHVLGLPTDAREMLLEEDGGIAGHRRRVQDAINEIAKAQDTLKETERNMGASITAKVGTSIIELAGLSGRLKKRDDGTYVFIEKPKPPASKRNVTPERRREPPSNPPTAPQQSPPQRPQRPPPPAASMRPAPSRTSNGVGMSQRTSPKREVPPVAVNSASNRPISPSPNLNPAGNGSNAQQNRTQPKQQGWYGFKPFGR